MKRIAARCGREFQVAREVPASHGVCVRCEIWNNRRMIKRFGVRVLRIMFMIVIDGLEVGGNGATEG